MEGAPLDDSVVDWGDDSIRSTNNGGVSKAAVDCDEPSSKSNNSIPTANKPQQQQPKKKQYRTLHEHLHTELTQLISVKSPLPSSNPLDTSERRQTSLRPVLLDKYTPSQLVHKSKNEDRRINKVSVVDRFIEVLRCDQTGLSAKSDKTCALVEGSSGNETVTEVNGPIHGCVSTHWKLLPPIYKKPPSPSPSNNNLPKVYKPGDGNQTTINTDVTQDENQDLDQNRELDNKEEEEMLIKGGGIKLPGLDWNKTFRKGYSILVWVRPSLDDSSEQRPQNESSAIGVREESEIGTTKNKERRKPQKQILYRFATSSNDNTTNSVGVCAMLGQWTAVPLSSKEDGGDKRRMLTTTVTAYTLPNSDPMSHLYPTDNDNETRQQPPSTAEKAARGTELGLTEETTTVETKEQRKERKKRTSKKEKAPTIGLVTPGNSSRQLEASQMASTSTTTPRLVGKLKKSSLRKGGSPRSRSTKSNDATSLRSTTSNNNNNGYISSTITLPENEWTLLSIQHTHPYLRRPELSIQVNGMNVLKDEIGYPILGKYNMLCIPSSYWYFAI